MMHSKRIDGLRIVNPSQSPDNIVMWKSRLISAMHGIVAEIGNPHKKPPYKFDSFYVPTKREHHTYMDVWGQYADALSEQLTDEDWRNVRRIDWRSEFDSDCMPFIEAYRRAEGQDPNKKRSKQLTTSPMRQKEAARDVGGTQVAVGTRFSNCRFTFYRRSDEPYAIEAQFADTEVHNIINDAYIDYNRLSSNDKAIGFTLVDCLRIILDMRREFYSVKYYGIHCFQFELNNGSLMDTEDYLSAPEQLLFDFDALWSQSDELVKETIKEKVNGSIHPLRPVL